MYELKEIRKEKGINQAEAAKYLGISPRSYKSYENEASKTNTNKYKNYCVNLSKFEKYDEENGILDLNIIKTICEKVFEEYDVEYCYLFGSYAKKKATEMSDVDLLISTKVDGLRYFGLVERLREALHKKVDLLKVNQLYNNPELLNEILKDGIKIYG